MPDLIRVQLGRDAVLRHKRLVDRQIVALN
jgi:hypothetical protein